MIQKGSGAKNAGAFLPICFLQNCESILQAGRIAEILGCTDEEVAPFVHLSILAINNYMIFAERALFDPQIEAVKKELSMLAERKGRNNR